MVAITLFYNALSIAYTKGISGAGPSMSPYSSNKIQFLYKKGNVCDICSLTSTKSPIGCIVYFPHLHLAEDDHQSHITNFMCLECVLIGTEWFLSNPDAWLGPYIDCN